MAAATFLYGLNFGFCASKTNRASSNKEIPLPLTAFRMMIYIVISAIDTSPLLLCLLPDILGLK